MAVFSVLGGGRLARTFWWLEFPCYQRGAETAFGGLVDVLHSE
jgi:hypothetical protein